MYSGALLVLRLLPCGEARCDAWAEVTTEGTTDGAAEGLAVVFVAVLAALKMELFSRSKSSLRRARRTSLNRPTERK